MFVSFFYFYFVYFIMQIAYQEVYDYKFINDAGVSKKYFIARTAMSQMFKDYWAKQ